MKDYTSRLNDLFLNKRFDKTDFIKIIDLDNEADIGFFITRSQILCIDHAWNYDGEKGIADVYSARIRFELSNGRAFYVFTADRNESSPEEFLNYLEDVLHYITGEPQIHDNDIDELYVKSSPNMVQDSQELYIAGSGKAVTW